MAWDSAPPTPEELKAASTPPKSASWDSTPPTPQELAGVSKGPGEGQTALEHGANAASFGYLPQLQAAAEKPFTAVANLLTGNDVKADDYITARDKNIARLKLEQEQNPKSALAGDIGGSVVNSLAVPIPGLGEGGGLMKLAAKGAAGGALQGAVNNPGDKPGVVDPVQAGARVDNAEKGAELGGVFGLGSGILSKGAGALARSGQTAEDIANNSAIKASGGMLKDFRSLDAKGKIDQVGQYALDNGIVKAGDKFEDVAAKAQAANKDAGTKLSSIYSSVQNDLAKAPAEAQQAVNAAGFNPVRDKDELLSTINKDLGNQMDKKAALNKVSDYLDQLAEDHGNWTMSPKETNDIKTEIDSMIKYSRNPLNPQPGQEKALSSTRKFLSGKVDSQISAIDDALGGKNDTLSALKQANSDYGNSATIKNMANDKALRDNANRSLGLTDTIAGGAGAGAGAIAGMAAGHPELGAIAGGLISGAANKAARTYGPAAVADVANKASGILPYTAEPVGNALSKIDPAKLTRALTELGLLRKDQ